ncbi:MAG TPA: membrane protein insertase YidC [Candidatus Omnitrophota bacterium]|nr:membrane protein insertase YidC [Candidatus Omnitrophota bacterium]
MEKRTLLAIAIAFVVLGFYPVVLQQFYPEYGKPAKRTVDSSAASPSSQPARTESPAFLAVPTETFAEGSDIALENESLKLLFNQDASLVREAHFKKFPDSATDKPIRFFSLDRALGGPFEVRILDGSRFSEVNFSYKTLRGADGSVLSTGSANGLEVSKSVLWSRSGYDGKFSLSIKNTSGEPLDLRCQIYAGSSIHPLQSIDGQYIEANFGRRFDGKTEIKHIKETKSGKIVESPWNVDWVALKDRHFAAILKPGPGAIFTGRAEGLGQNLSAASLVSGAIRLGPGQVWTQEFTAYIGPTELARLEPLGLGDIVNFGKLDWIGKLLVGAMELLHTIFRNYGVAIIMLTTLINILLFPLTRLSYMSMKRMQLIQPHMNKLREQHKKTPEKLNKEMMELYKKHKVNPFGGCLPMILQMPVFIALYVALSKAVILRNSSFLWVTDLSSPDRVSLPFSLPFLGNSLHVLPLIMIAGMVLQQKISQVKVEGQDPAIEMQQKMMAIMMPIVFGFIFYTMPAGLVLYWLTNTIIMTLYQWRLKSMTLSL